MGEAVEVGSGELPFERGGDLLVAATERQQLLFERVEVGEVVGGVDLALGDGEVDLGLVEPAGVDGADAEVLESGGRTTPTDPRTRIRFLYRPWSRLIERWPRCAEPLSTITNTRWALL